MREYVDLVCCGCKTPFVKEMREVKRQTSKGRNNFYCCLSCAKRHDPIDEFTPFRFFFTTSKKNAKQRKKDFNITLEYLKEQWDLQNGICPYTGKKMIVSGKKKHSLDSASLDRIDSSKGYIKGNIEYVCLFINLGKNGFSKQEVKDFLGQ